MHRPEINWDWALSIAGALQGELPDITRPDVLRLTSLLRTTADRAGQMAVEAAGLGNHPAPHVVVSDREGWAHGAAAMAESVLGTLGKPAPGGRVRSIRKAGYGAAVGVALGMISRGILGQFDAFSPQPALHLVAPNMLRMARTLPGPDEEFFLWVAVHEQTHAIQYTGIEWMRPTAMELFSSLAGDETGVLDVFGNLVRGRGGARSGQEQDHMSRLTALMTLSEGHADFVSDLVGRKHIPHASHFRRRFLKQRARTSRLQRLLPMVDKNAQYTVGLTFCRSVERRMGVAGLNRAFESPSTAPTMEELKSPGKWIRRMRGAS